MSVYSRSSIKFYTANVKHILQSWTFSFAKYVGTALLLFYLKAECYEFYGERLWSNEIVAHSKLE